jgi:hypothetical protein
MSGVLEKDAVREQRETGLVCPVYVTACSARCLSLTPALTFPFTWLYCCAMNTLHCITFIAVAHMNEWSQASSTRRLLAGLCKCVVQRKKGTENAIHD